MKAFVMKKYGGPEVTAISDEPKPTPRDGDVLVEIRAAALNPVDFKIRNGMLKMALPYKLPMIMGNEMSGTVIETGSKASRYKKGDEVYGRVDKDRIGTFAEYIAADEGDLAPKPESLSHEEAASIPLVGLTAWQCIHDKMKLKSGQKILIHAGAGGVGTFAIQLAKHIGAYVATTASAKNHNFLRELGADEVIDYNTQDFCSVIKDYDAVLDAMGGAVLEKSFSVVKPGGWVISIASMPDPETAKEMGMNALLVLVMRMMTAKVRRLARKAGVKYRFIFMTPSAGQLEEISQLLNSGAIKPIIDSVFPLDDAAKAFIKIEEGHARGKIVLKISGDSAS